MYCRERFDVQARMVDEQLQQRVTELIEQRVAEIMASDAVQQSLTQRLQAERQLLEQQVCFSTPKTVAKEDASLSEAQLVHSMTCFLLQILFTFYITARAARTVCMATGPHTFLRMSAQAAPM